MKKPTLKRYPTLSPYRIYWQDYPFESQTIKTWLDWVIVNAPFDISIYG